MRFLSGTIAVAAALYVSSAGSAPVVSAAETGSYLKQIEVARKRYENGNYKDAYRLYRKLALDGDNRSGAAGTALKGGIDSLRRLGRRSEIDGFREEAVKIHASDWKLLRSAARSYRDGIHYGFMIAGEFHRGPKRGGGERVNASERDRVRALQLMEQARKWMQKEDDAKVRALFYREYADMIMNYRNRSQAWRLQYLTDLSELPDYEKGFGYYYYMGHGVNAPVNEEGVPVYHRLPESYEKAAGDGERWRWLLAKAVMEDKSLENSVLNRRASFCREQFGVRTMRDYAVIFSGRKDSGDESASTKAYSLHTLDKDETMARLATGIKRFSIPSEFNHISLYSRIADNGKSDLGEDALNSLGEIFEDRRQYPIAARFWERSINEYGQGKRGWKKKRLDQIVGNWGRFEPVKSQPAGHGASFEFRYRNAESVTFEARRIDVRTLISDLKDYIRKNPRNMDWQKTRIELIGYRLVQGKAKKYVKNRTAEWTVELDPSEKHFDREITVTAPLQKPGAYWVTANVDEGNTSHIVLWVNDTAIVSKLLDDGIYYFVADALTGKPVERAVLEFFGYRRRRLRRNVYDTKVVNFAENADSSGQVFLESKKIPKPYTWLLTAQTGDGRFAWHGFAGIWTAEYHDREYRATKAYVVTDRPVYRPGHELKFKFWVRHAMYDKEDNSDFADKAFIVEISNPKGEKILEKTCRTDQFGGYDGSLGLGDDCCLGRYNIRIINPEHESTGVFKKAVSAGGIRRGGLTAVPVKPVKITRHTVGSGWFRVEEYKKPEFEVKVKAPSEPVMLGEKITAVISAEYYFGAPVTDARVKYKITRTGRSVEWYPPAEWDWFYGRGYWWFAFNYDWYPGWRLWGCPRPCPFWRCSGREQPEIVAQGEAETDAEGKVKLEIDTAIVKELRGDTDHSYVVTAEVTDPSRRTIVGSGSVLAARKPYSVYVWTERGHYRRGDTVKAHISGRTPDSKPVDGKAVARLLKISYDREGTPSEKEIERWETRTGPEGSGIISFKAAMAGQYRLSCRLRSDAGHVEEGGYIFTVAGQSSGTEKFRFNDIEIIADKKEYSAGDTARILVNTARRDTTVLLFLRPSNGIYLPPEMLDIDGKSVITEVKVTSKDMPGFFVEACTVSDGKLHTEMLELCVPPEKRVLNVEVTPSSKSYKPGDKALIRVRVTDFEGNPFRGSLAMSVYDRAVEYIAGGKNVGRIEEFFWKWRRHHSPRSETTLDRRAWNLVRRGRTAMSDLGVFGHLIARGPGETGMDGKAMNRRKSGAAGLNMQRAFGGGPALSAEAPAAMDKAMSLEKTAVEPGESAGDESVQPVVRTRFADTAFWAGSLVTDNKGVAEVDLDMPENLAGWNIRTWAMGHGTRVGEETVEIVTAKDLMLRLQTPRFFVEGDESVLSANIHNCLESDADVRAVLELDGNALRIMNRRSKTVSIKKGSQERVDWRVKAVREGAATVRMKALTSVESDAMEMNLPVYVHGMLMTESWSGMIPSDKNTGRITLTVPEKRKPEHSKLEIRYSPTLAGAMVDALPYLADYPHRTTDVTLNRFLPAVITHRILSRMGLDLEKIRDKKVNLNSQETGDPAERAKQWKRADRDAVFDNSAVEEMVAENLKALNEMQLADGGWGWFYGYREHSSSHMTAYVVHGLQVARDSGVAVVPGVMKRGVNWLRKRQERQTQKIRNASSKKKPWKPNADNMDAFVFMVLADEGIENGEMLEFLYRDRNHLSVYAKAMLGLALHKKGHKEKLAMIVRNIEQYLEEDDENQTAWLKLPNNSYWWRWYGSEMEAHAYYLKLLSRADPKSRKASRLAKYILNNRKHGGHWSSTRDTALCIEALADFLAASEEAKPAITVSIFFDGRKLGETVINADNLFSFDGTTLLEGGEIKGGKHEIEIRKKGRGPLYYNAYMTNFTLEDHIEKAGLEIRIERNVFRLVKADKTVKSAGSGGRALDKKVEKYRRIALRDGAEVKSGDLVEVELTLHSKNDYEYVMIEDMKAAGFESAALRSGYGDNELGAYMQIRDERTAFFAQKLARGKHSVSYRLRAETPGKFSALPARISAVYAPELKGNSDEIRLKIGDR
mgnify:CR=1 FL=1